MRLILFAVVLIFSPLLKAKSPNIVLILADDLSWADPGCYGNGIFETPHIDRLAASGMRFTQAYAAAPICSASRAGILTGKTPARLGFEFVTKNESGYQPVVAPLRAPPFTLNLDLAETTIAETLSGVGWDTAFFGKWHLNQHYQKYLGWSPTHGPGKQGFVTCEEDFGSHPYSYWKNKKERSFLELGTGRFPGDGMTERAVKFISQDHGAPFFCMVSHFYVHDPIHTRVRWLYDHYMEKIPDAHPRKKVVAQYGAMVTTLDHHVGELLDAIEASGNLDSTLVLFTSDNGGHPDYAGNAPLRGSKWNLYEGGIRVPLIASWLGRIPPGTTCDIPVSSLDLFSTFSGLADAGESTEMDGFSLMPLLVGGEGFPEDRSFYWHFPYYHPESHFAESPASIGVNDGVTSQTRPQSAIRKDNWKLIYFHEDQRLELYRLDQDIAEANDLSESDPKEAEALLAELKSYLEEVEARMPVPHPNSP